MKMIENANGDSLVLVVAPTGQDAPALGRALSDAGIAFKICGEPQALPECLTANVATLLVAEEALPRVTSQGFAEGLGGTPGGSSLPLVIMSSRESREQIQRAILPYEFGSSHAIVLERPVHASTLIAAVRAALQSRAHQKQICEELQRRRRTEALLSESNLTLARRERQFGTLVENSPDIIFRLDRDLRYVYINPTVERYVGMAPGDFTGRTLRELDIPQTILSPLIQKCGQVLEEGRPVNHEFAYKAGTREFYFLTRMMPQFGPDGRVESILGVVTDLSARRRAEHALQESEARLRELNATLEKRIAERTRLLELRREIAVASNTAESMEEALENALPRIARFRNETLGFAYARSEEEPGSCLPLNVHYVSEDGDYFRLSQLLLSLRLCCDQGLAGRAATRGRPVWTRDLKEALPASAVKMGKEAGLRSAIAVPVRIESEMPLMLMFFGEDARKPEDHFMEALSAISLILGWVVRRERWARHLTEVIAASQQHIGRELHDHLLQQLSGLVFLSESLQRKLATQERPEAADAAHLVDIIRGCQAQGRALLKGLRPVEVDAKGLMVALQEVADRTEKLYHISCTFECQHPVRVANNKVATQLFYIAQEAVNNAVKHSSAGHIRVVLHREQRSLELWVIDDGHGTDTRAVVLEEALHDGSGLRIMKHRARLIGAELRILPAEPAGTSVTCRLPQEIST